MKLVDSTHDRATSLTITFDEEELEFLDAVMSNISGCPVHSPRKHAEKLAGILCKHGYNMGKIAYLTGNTLHFEDYK